MSHRTCRNDKVEINKSVIILTYKIIYISETVEFSTMFTKAFFIRYDVLPYKVEFFFNTLYNKFFHSIIHILNFLTRKLTF